MSEIGSASLDELFEWRRRLAVPGAPPWKLIAVQRMIAKRIDSGQL